MARDQDIRLLNQPPAAFPGNLFGIKISIDMNSERIPVLVLMVSERTTNNKPFPCMEDSLHIGVGSFNFQTCPD